ncbi:SlyX family protein [Mesorhizobium xinjiangense]|uniref:SlyX family protein n=1 Tax=Mesorhizobium xinjiangense TaxID=2678685 RepID=UPI0012EDE7A5|nr:SlyX family protein [Mesorhizobium xinjiangense]
MNSDPERLARLEMIATEQERTIEELSGQLAAQWTVIDRLEKRLAALTQRLLELEEQNAPDVPVTRPPHY